MDSANKTSFTRRDFLYRAAAVGGTGLLLNTMNAWGMGIASTAAAPPQLSGSGKGKRVLILGAGLAGMTAAFELGKLGYDLEVAKLTPPELQFSQQAVRDYKRLSPVIWQGDLFRLRSPYEGNQAALVYVAENRRQAMLFGYNLHTRFLETVLPVKLQGLDPTQPGVWEHILEVSRG